MGKRTTLAPTAALTHTDCVLILASAHRLAIGARAMTVTLGHALDHLRHPGALATEAGRDVAHAPARDHARDLLSEPARVEAASTRTVTENGTGTGIETVIGIAIVT